MEKQKSNWIGILAILGIVAIALVAVILTNNQGNTTAKASSNQPILARIRVYYDDNNSFQELMYDPDEKVMYAMLDGKITPLYKPDGSLRTYEPEE